MTRPPGSTGTGRWLRRRRRPARRPNLATGTVWLAFDAGDGLYRYRCDWFGGPVDGHLLEQAGVAAQADAAARGLERSPSVRIRLPDHRTYWAGLVPDPGALAGSCTPRLPGPEPVRRATSAPADSDRSRLSTAA